MTINITRFHPDTCKCVFDYSWDSSIPADQRVHTIHEVIYACPIHAHHATKELLSTDVGNENNAKNTAIGVIAKILPRVIGNEEIVKWEFNVDRSIKIKISGLTQAERSLLIAADKSKIKKNVEFE